MNLLWLLGVPACLFVGCALITQTLKQLCDGSDDWWRLPLYMAVAFPVSILTILGIIYSGARAFFPSDFQ